MSDPREPGLPLSFAAAQYWALEQIAHGRPAKARRRRKRTQRS